MAEDDKKIKHKLNNSEREDYQCRLADLAIESYSLGLDWSKDMKKHGGEKKRIDGEMARIAVALKSGHEMREQEPLPL